MYSHVLAPALLALEIIVRHLSIAIDCTSAGLVPMS
jgi:hypothetical protein